MSSTASHRSSPYLNAQHPASKESTISNVAISNINTQKRSSLESPSAVNRAVAQLTSGHSGSYSSSINNSSGSPSPVAMMLRNSQPVSSGVLVSSSNVGAFPPASFSGPLGTQTFSSASSVASFSLTQAPTALAPGKYIFLISSNACHTVI